MITLCQNCVPVCDIDIIVSQCYDKPSVLLVWYGDYGILRNNNRSHTSDARV